MSHEEPRDGKRCDHCNRAPRAVPTTPEHMFEEGRFDPPGLTANRGEYLCHDCLNADVDRDIAAARAAAPVFMCSTNGHWWASLSPAQQAAARRRRRNFA
jgi:hypothetical protein